MMLNSLWMLYCQQPRTGEARKECKKALKIDCELTQKNP
jgi:hypothetical protein